jgi:hypothetical protein
MYWYAKSSLYNSLYNPTGNNDNKLPPVVHFTEGEASKLVYIGDFVTYSYEITVSSGSQEYKEMRSFLLLYLGNDKNVTIPDGITHIYEGAFRNNTTIESVVFSDTVDYIGRGAFAGCTALSNIQLSPLNSFQGLGAGCFSGCTSLKEIYLPNTILAIGEYCFSNSGLETINLENINIIHRYAFENCRGLTELSFGTSLNQIKDYAFKGTSVTTINYAGTKNEWSNIKRNFQAYWNNTISSVPVICSDGTAN